MNFGEALTALKDGSLAARSGWNGKNMYLVLQKGSGEALEVNRQLSQALGEPEGTAHKMLAHILMRTVDGAFVPWLASQTDILAEDWQLPPKQ